MATRVTISICYNGSSFPRVHNVSQGFLSRLEKFIAARPNLDAVVTVIGTVEVSDDGLEGSSA